MTAIPVIRHCLSSYGALKVDFSITRLWMKEKPRDLIDGIFSRVDARVEKDRQNGVPSFSLPVYAIAHLEEELQGCGDYEACKWFADRDI